MKNLGRLTLKNYLCYTRGIKTEKKIGWMIEKRRTCMQDKRTDGRVTLKDIAKITGYTINTVSRALNNKPDIPRETSMKIQKAAREAGYIRNWMAGSLRTGRSNTIAVIVGDLSNPFFALVVSEIESAAAEFGYTVIVLCTHETQETEENAIRVAIGRQVDGILLCPCQHEGDTVRLLEDARVPNALLFRHFPGQDLDALICDEYRGGYLAAEHLISAGHKKLVFLSCYGHVSDIALRRLGFMDACEAYGIPPEDRLVYSHTEADKTARYLLEKHEMGFTGVFGYCDMEAWKVITSVKGLGLRVPEDLSFIGYDNIQGKLGFSFSLCSIEMSLQKICQSSVRLLDEKIRGKHPQGGLSVFPVSMVCRGSCQHEHRA